MKYLLRFKITALLHERSHCEPHGVAETELIDQDLLFITWVRIVPFIRAESEDNCITWLLLVNMNMRDCLYLARMNRRMETIR